MDCWFLFFFLHRCYRLYPMFATTLGRLCLLFSFLRCTLRSIYSSLNSTYHQFCICECDVCWQIGNYLLFNLSFDLSSRVWHCLLIRAWWLVVLRWVIWLGYIHVFITFFFRCILIKSHHRFLSLSFLFLSTDRTVKKWLCLLLDYLGYKQANWLI